MLGSAEWCSSSAREAVAAAEEAAGDPCGIARILRDKRGSNLTKQQLMLLCAAWTYRADKWCAHTPPPSVAATAAELCVQLMHPWNPSCILAGYARRA